MEKIKNIKIDDEACSFKYGDKQVVIYYNHICKIYGGQVKSTKAFLATILMENIKTVEKISTANFLQRLKTYVKNNFCSCDCFTTHYVAAVVQKLLKKLSTK